MALPGAATANVTTTNTAFRRDHSRAIHEVRHRNLEEGDSRRKRGHGEQNERMHAPKRWPPGSVANSLGRTVKIRPGPLLLGSNPTNRESSEGKIMKPASSAIDVSSRTTHTAAALAIPSRFPRVAPVRDHRPHTKAQREERLAQSPRCRGTVRGRRERSGRQVVGRVPPVAPGSVAARAAKDKEQQR